MSDSSSGGNKSDIKAEILRDLEAILDRHFLPGDLEYLKGSGDGFFEYLTDGFEIHCKTRILPHLPGRSAQARA